jgi:hypothetical protein
MLAVLALAAVAAPATAAAAPMTPFTKASFAEAQNTGKPIVVFVHANW